MAGLLSTGGSTSKSNANARCVQLWNGIMQNPPPVGTAAGTVDYVAAAAGTVAPIPTRLQAT